MKTIEHLSMEDQKHYELCNCGEYFDCRDLAQVMNHLHIDPSIPAEWSFSVKIGEPVAYGRNGEQKDLN